MRPAPMVSMHLRLAASAVLFIVSASPAVAATPVSQLLRGADTATVSRGDFLRAAVKALKLPLQETVRDLPYGRVPAGYLPYVQTAHPKGALSLFGSKLELAKPITRGEAVQLVAKLTGAKAQDPAKVKFTDVKTGTPLADAVALASEQSWIRPLRPRLFGVDRPLTGREAKLFLGRLQRPTSNPLTKPGNEEHTVPILRVNIREKLQAPKQDVMQAVWDLLNDEYLYKERIDPAQAGNKAVQGIVDSLHDPYTTFMPPASAQNFQTLIKGEVEGIGATVEQTGGLIRIVTPLRGSPAEKAGLLPHDIILSADGVSFTGLTLDEAVNKIRGPAGSVVELRIRRNGKELIVPVVRETIRIPEVEITDQGSGIWVVKLVQFGQATDTRLREEFVKIQTKQPRGIILDLRNNPGGLLHAAGVVISNFMPSGTPYVSIRGRNETYDDRTEAAPTIDPSVPLIVLVNRGSASASEIVAGALQDLGRARLVGEKTFGKGTVQQLVQFSDGSSLKFTIAEWFTPKGRKIDGVGIQPDEVIEQGKERDDQLQRALQIIR